MGSYQIVTKLHIFIKSPGPMSILYTVTTHMLYMKAKVCFTSKALPTVMLL